MDDICPDFNLISLNVRGLNNFKRRRSMFNWFRRNGADIMKHLARHLLKGFGKINGVETLSIIMELIIVGGVTVLFKNHFDLKIVKSYQCSQGRILILDTLIKGCKFYLINIYSPNQESILEQFYRSLDILIQDSDLDVLQPIIIGGDWNTCLSSLDKHVGMQKLKGKCN